MKQRTHFCEKKDKFGRYWLTKKRHIDYCLEKKKRSIIWKKIKLQTARNSVISFILFGSCILRLHQTLVWTDAPLLAKNNSIINKFESGWTKMKRSHQPMQESVLCTVVEQCSLWKYMPFQIKMLHTKVAYANAKQTMRNEQWAMKPNVIW